MIALSRSARLVIVGAALVAGAVTPALTQTTYSIDPLLVELTADARNAVLTLTNTSANELRFEIKAFSWDQAAPSGEMRLTPTTDIVVFPPLVTMKAKSTQRIRVGTDVAQGAVEKAYRLMVEELPSGTAAKTGTQVSVRTRVGLPVFLAPTRPARSGRIDPITMSRGVVTIPLTNTGSIYAMVDNVAVRGMAATDTPLFEESLKGWYVLAGKSRTWTYTLSPAQCKQAKFLEVEVTAHDKVLTQRFDIPATGCAR